MMLVCAVALWATFGPQFGYSAIGGLLLYLATTVHVAESKLMARASNYIYEYFLLHGIFLVGISRFMPAYPELAILIAIAISIGSAYLLKRIHEMLFCWSPKHKA